MRRRSRRASGLGLVYGSIVTAASSTRPAEMQRSQRCTKPGRTPRTQSGASRSRDRKSTRLNSSHLGISYAVFCLKKKKQLIEITDGVDLGTPLLMTNDDSFSVPLCRLGLVHHRLAALTERADESRRADEQSGSTC